MVFVTTLSVLLIGAGHAMAVGYESYDTTAERHAKANVHPKTEKGLCEAIKRASFAEKYPAVIDEVASTVRDILSQFGLAKSTTR